MAHKKVTSELSLNHMDNPSIRTHFDIKFECMRRTEILLASVKYSMHDLIGDVIDYCVLSFNISKINVL